MAVTKGASCVSLYESGELPAMSDSRLLELSHSCCLATFVFVYTFSSGPFYLLLFP